MKFNSLRWTLPFVATLYFTVTSGQQSTSSAGGIAVFPFRVVGGTESGLSSLDRVQNTAQRLVADLQQRGARAELLRWPDRISDGDSERASLNALIGAARLRGLSLIALVAAISIEDRSRIQDPAAQPIDLPLPALTSLARRIFARNQNEKEIEIHYEGGLLDAHTGEAVASLQSGGRGSFEQASSGAARHLSSQILAAAAGVTAPSDPVRSLPGGLGFTRSEYRFAVDRDYDQRLGVEIANLGDRARRFRAHVIQAPSDLVVDFLGAGSTNAADLGIGQLQRLRLIVGAPAATRSRYNLALQLEDTETGKIADTVPVLLDVAPRQLRLQVEDLPSDPGLSEREIRITNLADEITDLRAQLSGELEHDAVVSPTVSQARLRTRESLHLRIRPRPAISPAKLQGDLVLSGNGAQYRHPIQLSGQRYAAASARTAAISDRAYELYRARSEYCSNTGGREILLRGPEGQRSSDGAAYLQMRFTLRHDRATFNEHDTTVLLNERMAGRLARRIPEGTYIFPVPTEWLDPSGNNKVRTKISGMSGASYSVVSDIRMLAPLDEWERLGLGSGSLQQRKHNSEINLDRPDIGVFANTIERLPVAPLDGERLAIPLLVKNLGQRTSRPGLLRLYNQDPKSSVTQNPVMLVQRLATSLIQRAALPLQRAGRDVPIPALAPGEEKLLKIEAIYLASVSTRLFVVAETNDDDFDPDNNVQTLTFYAPETASPLLGTDYPNIFKAPALGRMLKLPDRSYYRTLCQQRLWEYLGREDSLRNLRAFFGK